jgi:hypothetical protein
MINEPGSVPDAASRERTEWHGDTCLYFGCTDPDAAYEVLKGRNINLEPPIVTSYGMRQLYVSDPDGYSLCFQRPEK